MSSTKNEGAPKSGGPGATQQCGHEERISSERTAETRTKYDWARLHAEEGWSVVPMHEVMPDGTCSCRRDTCSAIGKHPRVAWQEFERRHATAGEIQAWWRRWPNANIGGVTGEISKRDIIDIDGQKGLDALAAGGIELPATVIVQTGRDDESHHAHFSHQMEFDVPTKASVLPGVDTRGRGGIVVLPGSDHASGREYRYREGRDPASIALAPFPPEVVERATAKKSMTGDVTRDLTGLAGANGLVTSSYVESAIQGELERIRVATEGHRNATLFKGAAAIGSLLHLSVNADVSSLLFDAAIESGLPEDEIIATVRNGLQRGSENPRDLTLRQPEVLEPRPPYPLHVLPPAVRNYVVEAAECVGCPPDMVAVPLLAYAAATIGRTASIEIKARYVKHPVFWFGVVGAPGSGKSPADGLARSFAENLQAKAYAEWQTAHQEWRTEHELWKQRLRGKGSGKAVIGSESFHVDPEPEEPMLEHYFTTDATIEALAPMLQSSAGVAVAHDELVGWVKSMGVYNGAAGRDRAQVLSLWAERSLKVDRKGRPPLYVEDPVAVIIGGVQPDVLTDLAGEADKHDGFIDRFLWSWPEHQPTTWTEATVSCFTAAEVERIFRRLRARGAHSVPITLSDEAKDAWRAWYDDNSRAIDQANGVMAGIHAKADVHLARLALVLHVLSHDEPGRVGVSGETLRAAAELVDYHVAHARAVVGRLGAASASPRTGRGSTLRQRILALMNAAGEWTSATDIAKGLGGHIPATVRDAELARMEAAGLVERRVRPSGELGGRPAIQWALVAEPDEAEASAKDVA